MDKGLQKYVQIPQRVWSVNIIQLTKGNLTALMVTHDMMQALKMGKGTIMMDKGEIILDISDLNEKN